MPASDSSPRRAHLPPSPVPPEALAQFDRPTGALQGLAETFPDFEVLVFVDRRGDEVRVSFAEIWQRSREIQSALAERGVQPRDVVLMALPTGAENVAAYFGIQLAGAIPAVVVTAGNRFADPKIYGPYVAAIAQSSGAEILLTDETTKQTLQTAWTGSSMPCEVVPTDLLRPDGPLRDLADVSAREITSIQYSSGSTGNPKGVLLTGAAILENLRAMQQHLEIGPKDVFVNWIPLYHDMGLIAALLLPMLAGARTVLLPTMDFLREPSSWLRAVDRYRGSVSFSPNFGYAIAAHRLSDDEVEGLDLGCWRLAVNASEPVLPETMDDFCERFGKLGFQAPSMVPAWGLAESVSFATMCIPKRMDGRVDPIARDITTTGEARPTTDRGIPVVTCGPLIPGCEIEVRDDDGTVLGERRLGRVWLRTDALFEGYLDDPELTAQRRAEGWLDTGDRGYLVGDQLYFYAREKDLIIIGGEKLAPHEIESRVSGIDGVRPGCVIAFGRINTDRGTEELVVVAETRETDDETRKRLEATIRTSVTRLIGLGARHVLLVDPGGIGKTTSGKLARTSTAAKYAAELPD